MHCSSTSSRRILTSPADASSNFVTSPRPPLPATWNACWRKAGWETPTPSKVRCTNPWKDFMGNDRWRGWRVEDTHGMYKKGNNILVDTCVIQTTIGRKNLGNTHFMIPRFFASLWMTKRECQQYILNPFYNEFSKSTFPTNVHFRHFRCVKCAESHRKCADSHTFSHPLFLSFHSESTH